MKTATPSVCDNRMWSHLGTKTTVWLIVIAAVLWLTAILAIDDARFVVLAPTAKVGIEVILALSSLFGALVLLLFPTTSSLRMQWIAAGFLVLGISGLTFGYLQPLVIEDIDLNRSRYVALLIQTIAGVIFAVGLVTERAPSLSIRVLATIIVATTLSGALLYRLSTDLPALVEIQELDSNVVLNQTTMPGLMATHWVLSLIPLSLAIVGAAGAVRWSNRNEIAAWIAIAMALRFGAQLHAMFWPSGYSPALTTSSLFRVALTFTVVLGGVLDLRRIAREREAMLASEQEYRRRLESLALLRADFTSMIAHELSRPVSAIRRFTEILEIGDLAPSQRYAAATIQNELDILSTLVNDVQSSARIERDDFQVRIEPIPLDDLLRDTHTYARALPGDHPVQVSIAEPVWVFADPERIRQVLQNLLSNAAKYSPHSSPIEVRAYREADTVRIDVIDQGFGIHPDDLDRVFEKFGRGRTPEGERIGGVGLGLYLSRRIVQAHGSDLIVRSSLDAGSVFTFSLRIAS